MERTTASRRKIDKAVPQLLYTNRIARCGSRRVLFLGIKLRKSLLFGIPLLWNRFTRNHPPQGIDSELVKGPFPRGLRSHFVTAAVAMMMIVCGPAFAFADGSYHVQDQWKVGGEGGWDYLAVDPQTKLLYITRGNHVMVVNPKSGKVIADITGLKGTHGVVFDSKGKFGYITDGGANEVAVFDRKTNQIVERIPAGTNPDGVVFEPVTGTVWAFNGRSKNATVIDTATNKVIATVALPGKPEFPVADAKGSVFANIEDTSQMVHLDARTHAILATWSLAPCVSPSGLAIDRQHERLFSVCDGGTMAVVDGATGKIVATPTIGDRPDAARFDAKTHLAFSSNGQGTLTVVRENSPNSFSVLQNVPTKAGARTMALDEESGKVYVVTADFGPRPAATAENPRPRPTLIPGTFEIIVVSP